MEDVEGVQRLHQAQDLCEEVHLTWSRKLSALMSAWRMLRACSASTRPRISVRKYSTPNLEQEVVCLDVGMEDVEGVQRLHQAQDLCEEVHRHRLDAGLVHIHRLEKLKEKK
jgi:hypothetical protein